MYNAKDQGVVVNNLKNMDKQIIAIGGGGFGRNPGVGIIEKYILDQSDKDSPNICFIPTMGSLHNGHLSLVDLGKKTNFGSRYL